MWKVETEEETETEADQQFELEERVRKARDFKGSEEATEVLDNVVRKHQQ